MTQKQHFWDEFLLSLYFVSFLPLPAQSACHYFPYDKHLFFFSPASSLSPSRFPLPQKRVGFLQASQIQCQVGSSHREPWHWFSSGARQSEQGVWRRGGPRQCRAEGTGPFGSSSRSFPMGQERSLLERCLVSAGWMDKLRQDVPGPLVSTPNLKNFSSYAKKRLILWQLVSFSVTELPPLFHLMWEETLKSCEWEERGRHRASQASLPFLTQNNNCVIGLISWDESYSSGAKFPLERSPVVVSLCVFACFDAHLCEFGNMRYM